MYLTRCESLKRHILSAERSLIHSRESFVRDLGKDVVAIALNNSRVEAQKALELCVGLSTCQQNEFAESRGYNHQSLVQLIVHIDYHIDSLLLKEFDSKYAKLNIARSLANRIAINADKPHDNNEIYRSENKIADALSQSQELSIALRLYNDIAAPMKKSNLLSSFWKARALNNMANAHFAIGRDQHALDGMVESAQLVSIFFSSFNVNKSDFSDAIADIKRLKERLVKNIIYPSIRPCEQFCDLVSMGSVSTDDILHLLYIRELIKSFEETKEKLDFVFDKHHVAVFAYECLERIV